VIAFASTLLGQIFLENTADFFPMISWEGGNGRHGVAGFEVGQDGTGQRILWSVSETGKGRDQLHVHCDGFLASIRGDQPVQELLGSLLLLRGVLLFVDHHFLGNTSDDLAVAIGIGVITQDERQEDIVHVISSCTVDKVRPCPVALVPHRSLARGQKERLFFIAEVQRIGFAVVVGNHQVKGFHEIDEDFVVHQFDRASLEVVDKFLHNSRVRGLVDVDLGEQVGTE